MRMGKARFSNEEAGATAVEYGLILALVFLAMIGGVRAFGLSAIEMWNTMSDMIVTSTSA